MSIFMMTVAQPYSAHKTIILYITAALTESLSNTTLPAWYPYMMAHRVAYYQLQHLLLSPICKEITMSNAPQNQPAQNNTGKTADNKDKVELNPAKPAGSTPDNKTAQSGAKSSNI